MERVMLNGSVFAVGLRWLPPVKRRIMGHKARVALAESLDATYDVASTRRCPGGIQVGFGSAGDDAHNYSKAPALCACLNVQESFLGLFSLRSVDGTLFWWLHLRVDGVVAEPGDQIFDSREAATEWLELMRTVSGLESERFDSPMQSAAWLEEHVRFRAVDKWVLSTGQISGLNRIASRSTIRTLSAAGAVLMVCISAGLGWSHYHEQAALAAAREEHAARLQRKAEMEQYPERFFSADWQSRPLASDFAGMCLPAMMRVPLVANGWRFSSVTCDGKKISVSWGHEGGADFTRPPEGARLDEKDVRVARSVTPLSGAVPVLRPDGIGTDYSLLLTRDEVLGLLAEITQSTGTKTDEYPGRHWCVDPADCHAAGSHILVGRGPDGHTATACGQSHAHGEGSMTYHTSWDSWSRRVDDSTRATFQLSGSQLQDLENSGELESYINELLSEPDGQQKAIMAGNQLAALQIQEARQLRELIATKVQSDLASQEKAEKQGQLGKELHRHMLGGFEKIGTTSRSDPF